MHVDGVAMFRDSGIPRRDLLSGLERVNFEYEDAAYGVRRIIEGTRGDEDPVLRHLMNIGHVGRLNAISFGFGERFTGWYRAQERDVVSSGPVCSGTLPPFRRGPQQRALGKDG